MHRKIKLPYKTMSGACSLNLRHWNNRTTTPSIPCEQLNLDGTTCTRIPGGFAENASLPKDTCLPQNIYYCWLSPSGGFRRREHEMDLTRTRPSLYGDIAHGLGFWTDRSAVHEAAAQGRVVQLQQLIEDGAAVNIVSVDSITPLHEACIQGQTQCVKLLLAAGAQVDARNIDGSTPLCDACAAGSLECVKLLLEYGATVNPPLFTFSPLHEACMGGNSDCVQIMIDQGALMEAHDCHYGTPLHVACARQHYDCVKVLLNAGANVNAAKLHETALHHAAKVKNTSLIELLVEFGGNVYARDNMNKKPIDYTSRGSPSYCCLEFYENTPLTLQQLSRVTLRRALGTKAHDVVSKLGLPSRIINFLCYAQPPVFEL